MNIFILSTNPVLAAQMQCDKHVVKMILETTQILSTVLGGPYKPTHQNHPCVKWAAETVGNRLWLIDHGIALCDEYTERYEKRHKCADIIESFSEQHNDHGLCDDLTTTTPFVQCMPERYRCDNPVSAYRAYYHSKAFAEWNRGRPAPDWWQGATQ